MSNKLLATLKPIASALLLVSLMSCGPAPDKLGKLDLIKWREDQGGCQNIRAGLVNDFRAVQQTEIKGKSANQIGALLGIPDRQQLADRNQKYYVYFVGSGPHCTDRTNLMSSPTVAIRFSAMGIATEVTYQKGMP